MGKIIGSYGGQKKLQLVTFHTTETKYQTSMLKVFTQVYS